MEKHLRNEHWIRAFGLLLWIPFIHSNVLNKKNTTDFSILETVQLSEIVSTTDIRWISDRRTKEQQQQQPERTIFYAIGDIPYTSDQQSILQYQMENLIPHHDAEFVIHVGDIRNGKNQSPCTRNEFHNVATILQYSPVPVFIIRTCKFFFFIIVPRRLCRV